MIYCFTCFLVSLLFLEGGVLVLNKLLLKALCVRITIRYMSIYIPSFIYFRGRLVPSLECDFRESDSKEYDSRELKSRKNYFCSV